MKVFILSLIFVTWCSPLFNEPNNTIVYAEESSLKPNYSELDIKKRTTKKDVWKMMKENSWHHSYVLGCYDIMVSQCYLKVMLEDISDGEFNQCLPPDMPIGDILIKETFNIIDALYERGYNYVSPADISIAYWECKKSKPSNKEVEQCTDLVVSLLNESFEVASNKENKN